jgi:hypothetical protein
MLQVNGQCASINQRQEKSATGNLAKDNKTNHRNRNSQKSIAKTEIAEITVQNDKLLE